LVYVTGDLHSHYHIEKLNSKRFPAGRKLTKADYLIVVGDFGLLWQDPPTDRDKYYLEWLRAKGWTTLFLDGNHENFEMLGRLETREMLGGSVGVVNDSVFHLRRGNVYTIDELTFFIFGGARSYDKEYRVEHISWWSQEEPSYAEYMNADVNLTKHQNKVDYVLTHEAPASVIDQIYPNDLVDAYQLPRFLEDVVGRLEFKRWYFGHHHFDKAFDQFVCLFNRVREIGT